MSERETVFVPGYGDRTLVKEGHPLFGTVKLQIRGFVISADVHQLGDGWYQISIRDMVTEQGMRYQELYFSITKAEEVARKKLVAACAAGGLRHPES